MGKGGIVFYFWEADATEKGSLGPNTVVNSNQKSLLSTRTLNSQARCGCGWLAGGRPAVRVGMCTRRLQAALHVGLCMGMGRVVRAWLWRFLWIVGQLT